MKIERETKSTELIVVKTNIAADVFDDTDVITSRGYKGILLTEGHPLEFDYDSKTAPFMIDEESETLIIKVSADSIIGEDGKFIKEFNKTLQAVEALEEAFAEEIKEYKVPKVEGK